MGGWNRVLVVEAIARNSATAPINIDLMKSKPRLQFETLIAQGFQTIIRSELLAEGYKLSINDAFRCADGIPIVQFNNAIFFAQTWAEIPTMAH